ncbi:zinc finger protein 512B [Lepisosteus oculatus]|uniref:zinc finger protein 512B n=1 Tax=Lepisosteus oculatus TaxID=7918 RepID=UPI0007402720|nr:PREDICTED: zinc finger protein 512B [Lepisosteus oculatus]XP_015220320.1 PREDICTED: zinc finger protein 512B [Lepisosteus oculatus]XP_015220321.1 PREDICTED: zinc finger protein 512B [Lepisosteus oculatus]XP_015220322.1 PREDICTED: zinc finger protein 512B [Lepisosteus oculatus]XP_015220323.1 PREDICTED: zinc finger protein 512B [Lepisosteus oculatus]
MADSSRGRLGHVPSGGIQRRLSKPAGLTATAKKVGREDTKLGTSANEKVEGKKKGRPRAENQELRSIPAAVMASWKEEFKNHSRVKCPSSGCWLEFPSIYGLKYHYQRCQGATIAEKLSHRCPYCEAVFASKIRLEKHKAWNHADKASQEPKVDNKVQKTPVKGNAKKRAAENADAAPGMCKMKKMQEVGQLSQNGDCVVQKADKKHSQATSSEASPKTPGGSESEAGSLPSLFPEEDPERTRHRRKQKTPKKFTGEQPSISGTFGMKGLSKSEDKMKASRARKSDGNIFHEEAIRKLQASTLRKESSTFSAGSPEAQWQHAISERGEIVCPTCSLVSRKTVLGLKKHMEICQKLQDALKCQHCQKQFKSKAGLNYHTMAEHSHKPVVNEGHFQDGQEERERLRRVLKQMGKLKCHNEGCTATFSSLMGYQYHQRRCGKELSDTEKPIFKCEHCGKTYKSKAGHDYHIRCEHTTARDLTSPKEPEPEEHQVAEEPVEDFERTPSGRVRRRSAQVAVFHLQEIAEDELAKDWSKRRMKDDLVPDSKRLNYTRPGLPKFNPKMLESWKNEVKEKGFICCPSNGCEAIYSSVSGLKAHLANCNKGGGAVGKYRCLLCQKEFSSESGVKYHIIKTHSQNWFRAANQVTPHSKRKDQHNGLKKDLKNSTTGKRRGRKPKERLPEMSQKDSERSQSKTSNADSPESTSSANRSLPGPHRETKTPVKKRGKPRKMPPE